MNKKASLDGINETDKAILAWFKNPSNADNTQSGFQIALALRKSEGYVFSRMRVLRARGLIQRKTKGEWVRTTIISTIFADTKRALKKKPRKNSRRKKQ